MKFIRDNADLIGIVFMVLVSVVCFVAPLLVRVARDMWQWALM